MWPEGDPKSATVQEILYWQYREQFRKEYKKKHPKNKSVAAVGKTAGDKWKFMSEKGRLFAIWYICGWEGGDEEESEVNHDEEDSGGELGEHPWAYPHIDLIAEQNK
ncbi:PREDICTED: HMG1/2-like protein [Ipomoea nil]|uniref:HMG1/2-like protein n=1 Tax=Ipomoea nil TaxID=35883 RepID=UPI000901B557|nr:PREDICTED: HMG1/2-like protein [Ipomoea nil]